MAEAGGIRVGRHPHRQGAVVAFQPGLAAAGGRQQQGIGTRPPLTQPCFQGCGQGGQEAAELGKVIADEDQSLCTWTPLKPEQASYRPGVAGIAAQAKAGFRGVGDDAAPRQEGAQAAGRGEGDYFLFLRWMARQPMSVRIWRPAKSMPSATS